MDGFLVIDKPAGWTSHDVVARVRRLAGQRRVGHTGTLDPEATGVLLVCLGFAGRLIEYTEGYSKRYVAVLSLGVATDTQDATGAPLCTADASHITESDLQSVLPGFRGRIMQVPPMVSAVRHKGERLHEIARRGETVERPARPVTVTRLQASEFSPGPVATVRLEVECSAGTYVRTLCHDIGAALGVGGHMSWLRRTAVGPFDESMAVTLEELAEPGRLTACLLPPQRLLPPDWPEVELDDEAANDIAMGRSVPAEGPGRYASAVHRGRLLAVLVREDDRWRPEKGVPR
jgi:tRNA pseudouridine55 synthase